MGVGHTAALLVVATLLGLAGATLPPRLGTVFELAVAVMLIAIGMRSLSRAARHRGNREDDHVAHAGVRRRGTGAHLRYARRSLVVGTIHGLAGSGAVALVASRLASAPVFFMWGYSVWAR